MPLTFLDRGRQGVEGDPIGVCLLGFAKTTKLSPRICQSRNREGAELVFFSRGRCDPRRANAHCYDATYGSPINRCVKTFGYCVPSIHRQQCARSLFLDPQRPRGAKTSSGASDFSIGKFLGESFVFCEAKQNKHTIRIRLRTPSPPPGSRTQCIRAKGQTAANGGIELSLT